MPWAVTEESNWKQDLVVNKIVVFGDSWMLRRAVGGQSETAFSYVLAKQLDVEIDTFADYGLTSAALSRIVATADSGILRRFSQPWKPWQIDAVRHGPHDLVLLHIGGNDIQPCVLTCWFVWWSDYAQREHVRGYLREIVRNIGNIVESLCKKGFRHFVIAMPPFSRHVPLTNMVTTKSLQRLREETERIFTEEFAANKWQDKGCQVCLFNEPQHLDLIHDEKGLGQEHYVDMMHPKAQIHHQLGLRLYHQLAQSSFLRDGISSQSSQKRAKEGSSFGWAFFCCFCCCCLLWHL